MQRNSTHLPYMGTEFSRFTTLSLSGPIALLDSPNIFRVILGVLTLFSKLKVLHIELETSYQAVPTPIDLETWMVEAILDRSPNITSISCNGTAPRITTRLELETLPSARQEARNSNRSTSTMSSQLEA